MWFLINGWLYAFDIMNDFLPSLGFYSGCEQFAYARRHFFRFAFFGVPSLLLCLITYVSPFFFFTNAYSSALLFEDLIYIEEHRRDSTENRDWEGYAKLHHDDILVKK